MRRAQFDTAAQPVVNLVSNPSFEAAGASAAVRTNLATNPSFETAGALTTIRTNLATNPSFEATIGTYDVRTNLAINPSFETANGTVNVRTNLFNGATMLLGAGATQVTGVSYGGATWTRLSSTTAGHGLRAYANLADLVNGANYAAEWEVANDGVASVGISLDWCDTSTSGGFHTIAAGERKRIKVIGTKATYDATYRFADIGLNTADTNILFREILIEKDDISGPYFDGSTAASGDFTYAWTGTANASASNQVGTGLTGVGPANQAAVYRTGSTGARAAKILFKGATIVDSGLSFASILSPAASKTYTVSVDLTSDIARTVKFSAQGTGTVNQNSVNISLSAGVTSRQSWTFTTTATAPTSVALYILRADLLMGTLSVDNMLIEEGTVVATYFDGGTAAAGDFTYLWSGVANASTSIQRAPAVENLVGGTAMAVIQSKDWKLSGANSARVIPRTATQDTYGVVAGVTLQTGKTYTISATCRLAGTQTSPEARARKIVIYHSATSHSSGQAANAAGSTRLSVTFTVTDGSVYQSIRLYNGASQGNGDVWWDDLLIEETPSLQPYFDGTNTIGNLAINNPNLEVNLDGWATNDATKYPITRSTVSPIRGTASAVVTRSATSPDTIVASIWANGKSPTNLTSFKVSPGQSLSFSMDVRSSASNRKAVAYIAFRNAAGASIGSYGTTETTLTNGVPIRAGSSNITVPVNADSALFVMSVQSTDATTVPANETATFDGLLIENSPTITPYYYEGTGDYTYSWSGSANASTSLQRATYLSNVSTVPTLGQAFQSTLQGVTHGSKALRIVPTSTSTDSFAELGNMFSGYTFKANTTYTLSADRTIAAPLTGASGVLIRANIGTELSPTVVAQPPNTAGTSRMVLRFTTGSATNLAFIRLYAGTTYGNGDVWYDKFLLEEGVTDGSYFDGSTSASGDYTYSWLGTANASVSRQNAPSLTSVVGGNTVPHQSSEWSVSGKSMRVVPLDVAGSTATSVSITATLVPGRTYTALATRRLTAPLTGTLNSAYGGRMALVQPGLATLASDALPNVAGVGTLRWTFKVDPAATGHTFRLGHGGVSGSGEVWWDNLMIVEGTYNGEYIDGSKPFSRWSGTTDASTSVGYPPQLLDIAGKPSADVIGIGDTGTITVDPFAARTVYFVYESTDINASWQAPLYYGVGGSNGLTFQTNAAGVDTVAPRVDFSGGDSNRTFVSSSRGVGRRHVLAMSFPQGIASAAANFNGGADIVQTYTSTGAGWSSGRLYTVARTGITAVRAMVYYAEHDATTRQAVSRYLGNKYGANVV